MGQWVASLANTRIGSACLSWYSSTFSLSSRSSLHVKVKHKIYQKIIHQRVYCDSLFVLLLQTDLCASALHHYLTSCMNRIRLSFILCHILIFYFLDQDCESKIFYKISIMFIEQYWPSVVSVDSFDSKLTLAGKRSDDLLLSLKSRLCCEDTFFMELALAVTSCIQAEGWNSASDYGDLPANALTTF